MVRLRRQLLALVPVVFVAVAGCGDAEPPASPTPVVNADVTTISGGNWSGSIIVGDGSTTGFNMTLIGRGLGQEANARTRLTTGTIEVTGNFTTGIGLTGTVQGVLQGTLRSGTFDGSLTSDSPACTRRYGGPITESTVAWIPSGPSSPGCPLNFSIQLPRPLGPDCQYAVSLSQQTFSGNGGSGELRITTGEACTWAAESLDSWILVEDPSPRVGSGRVGFTARPNQQDAREGRLRVAIANQTFIIAQGQNCTYAVSPPSVAVPAAGGTSTLTVTAPAQCEWSAQSSVPWLTVAPSAGSGSATVTVTAQPSGGPSRSGTISVGGQTVAVSQGQGCDVTVTPVTVTAPGTGRSGTLQVNAAAGCSWAAQTNVSWIGVAPQSGSGAAAVNFTVLAHNGPERTGIISVSGRTVTVTQASGCIYAVDSTQPPSLPANATTINLTITTINSCEWTVESTSNWLTFPGQPNPFKQSGTLTFAVNVAANDADNAEPRDGTLVLTGDGAISITIVIRQTDEFTEGIAFQRRRN